MTNNSGNSLDSGKFDDLGTAAETQVVCSRHETSDLAAVAETHIVSLQQQFIKRSETSHHSTNYVDFPINSSKASVLLINLDDCKTASTTQVVSPLQRTNKNRQTSFFGTKLGAKSDRRLQFTNDWRTVLPAPIINKRKRQPTVSLKPENYSTLREKQKKDIIKTLHELQQTIVSMDDNYKSFDGIQSVESGTELSVDHKVERNAKEKTYVSDMVVETPSIIQRSIGVRSVASDTGLICVHQAKEKSTMKATPDSKIADQRKSVLATEFLFCSLFGLLWTLSTISTQCNRPRYEFYVSKMAAETSNVLHRSFSSEGWNSFHGPHSNKALIPYQRGETKWSDIHDQ